MRKPTGLIILCFFIFLDQSVAQGVQKEELVAAYVYSFAKNIKWPASEDPFHIQLITDNDALVNEFNTLAQTKMLKSRPIQVVVSSSVIISQQSDLVFVSNNFNSTVRSVFLQLKDLNTLLVTEEFPDDRFIMIDMQSERNNTLGFEINRANIINQGLEVMPDLILLGGTEVDMAQLYREAQDSIQALESDISMFQNQSDSLTRNMIAIQNDIAKQKELVRYQSLEIKYRQSTINQQNNALDSLERGILNSEERLSALTNQMMEREEQFKQLQKDIENQQEQLEEGELVLGEQYRLIEEQDEMITARETSLERMVSVVSTQKRTVLLLVLFSIVAVGFLILAYRAYKQRRDHAKVLSERRDELEKLLNELQDTQAQLVQSEKMASLGVLTAGIAHEINNAINFVSSGIHILEIKLRQVTPVINKVRKLKKDEGLMEEVDSLIELKDKIGYDDIQLMIREVVKNIRIGTSRTTDIVKGLRTFSMSDTESLVEVDLESELNVALLFLNNRLRGKVEIKRTTNDIIEPIQGYGGQIGQVFLNILSNAADALEDCKKPEIEITLSKVGKKVKVEIADNGVGIAPDEIDNIFDPFFTTKKIGSGTGLGLSITYGIIERHQGEISVWSKEDVGTKFTILLPLKIEQ